MWERMARRGEGSLVVRRRFVDAWRRGLALPAMILEEVESKGIAESECRAVVSVAGFQA
jgi:hypothetical protein